MIPAVSLLENSVDYEDAVNYGRLGWELAKDLSQLFDRSGFYDRAELEKSNKHKQALSCIEEKYENADFIVDDYSDISAVKIGHQALLDKLGEETMKELPGENYRFTNEQIYFLSFANRFCQSTSYLRGFSSSKHRSDSIRVLNALENSEEFAQAFNCATSSPMNPQKKCTIW